jgi:hypothetical protein
VTAEDRHSGDKLGTDSDAGVMLRPETSVLPNEALVPERNLVRPAPNRFTHELLVDEPYRFDRPERAGEPDGVLPSGTSAATNSTSGCWRDPALRKATTYFRSRPHLFLRMVLPSPNWTAGTGGRPTTPPLGPR